MVESLDGQQRLLLQQFLRIDPPRPNRLPSLEQILKHGNNELMAYGYVPFFRDRAIAMATKAISIATGCATPSIMAIA